MVCIDQLSKAKILLFDSQVTGNADNNIQTNMFNLVGWSFFKKQAYKFS